MHHSLLIRRFVIMFAALVATGASPTSAMGAAPPHAAHASPTSPSPEAVPQVCHVRHKDGACLTLTMELLPRPKLQRECQRVADYLALPPAPLPPFAVTEAQRALTRLGYFKDIACSLTESREMSCALVSIPIVHSISIRGHLPMALLQEDIRRRVSLRPGVLMPDMTADLHRQSMRLEQYLRGEGYFDAVVAVTPTRVPGEGLGQDTHLSIDIAARDTAMVRRVQFEGDPIIATEKLAWPFWQRGFLGLHRAFRPSKLSDNVEAATQLLRDEGYVGAHLQASYTHHPEAHAIDVTVRVTPGRRVRVSFVGNTAVSDRRLRRLMPFAASGAVDAVAVEEMRLGIERLYQEKGFAEVDVQATLGRTSARDIDVTYVIDAGERYSVTAVVFDHPAGLKPASLFAEGVLLQRPSGRFTPRRWVDVYVQHDESTLQGVLRSRGFPEAQVQAHKQPGGLPNTLVLRYAVDLGPSRRVREVVLNNVPHGIDAQSLKKRLQMQDGGPFVLGGIDNDLGDIESRLATHGYITSDVKARMTLPDGRSFDNEQALVQATAVAERTVAVPADEAAQQLQAVVPITVTYTLTPGPQARLGGIFIHGNFRTRSSTLLQEMNAAVDRPINLAAVGAARRSLRNLNLFNAVQLTPAHSSLGTSRTWLVLAVEERNVRTLEAVGAFSSDFRFSLGADFKDANVFGRAMLLTLTARLSNAHNLAWRPLRIGDQDLLEARLRAPHPFGLKINAEASVLYRYRDVASYRERRLTGMAAVSKPVLHRLRCSICPDVTTRLAYEVTDVIFTNKSEPDDGGGPTTIARIIPKIIANRRDSPTDPRRGASMEAAFEVAHPAMAGNLGDRASAFVRLLIGVQGYVPLGVPARLPLRRGMVLGGPFVLAMAGNVSLARPYGPRGGVPDSEAFGYGGDMSVRGLTYRASTVQLDDAHAMVTASAELRWYVLENVGVGDIQVAGFIDSGTVSAHAHGLFDQQTLSMGPALRYVTPFGPVSVAYGRALVLPAALRRHPDQAPKHGRVHFTFGYGF